MSEGSHGYRIYWLIWGILLVLTLMMIVIDAADMGQASRAGLLLIGSATKALLIIFYFMHLRFEKAGLMIIVLVGLFLTSTLMFTLPAFDGTQIFKELIIYPGQSE